MENSIFAINSVGLSTTPCNSNIQNNDLSNITDFTKITDPALYKLCKEYGKQSRKWAREFGFLLPEVARRQMHRKYGCSSLEMFAAKLAGMSHRVVERILSLHKKLIAKPLLWAEFRRFGWSKLRVVAEVCDFENENFWVDKVRKCPKMVLEEYVRKYKAHQKTKNAALDTHYTTSVPSENAQSQFFSSNKPQNTGALKLGDNDSEHKNTNFTAQTNENLNSTRSETQNIQTTFKKLKFNVDLETEFLFKEFKQNLEKQQKKALTMGETLKELLKVVKNSKSKNEILDNTTKKAEVQPRPSDANAQSGFVTNKKPPRHLKKQQKTEIHQTYGTKCSFPGCNNPSLEIHHPDRFAANPSHKRIYPLCRLHHQAAHTGTVKNEDQPIKNWDFEFENNLELEKEVGRVGTAGFGETIEDFCLEDADFDTKLEQIFKLHQKLEKAQIDAKVRNHWI